MVYWKLQNYLREVLLSPPDLEIIFIKISRWLVSPPLGTSLSNLDLPHLGSQMMTLKSFVQNDVPSHLLPVVVQSNYSWMTMKSFHSWMTMNHSDSCLPNLKYLIVLICYYISLYSNRPTNHSVKHEEMILGGEYYMIWVLQSKWAWQVGSAKVAPNL